MQISIHPAALLCAYMLAFTSLSSCGTKIEGTGSQTQQSSEIKILAVNDMHSAIDRFGRLAYVVDSIRAKYPDVLLLSAGDNRTGNPANDMDPGSNMPMMELMSMVGFDASAIGNHEFDKGTEVMAENIRAAKFPFLCANAHPSPDLNMPIEPYRIFRFGDYVRIGVLSLIQVNSRGIPDCLKASTAGVSFTDPELEATNSFALLRRNCGAVVFLTHLGLTDDFALASRFPDVDMIIGGHSHDAGEGHNGNVLITQAGKSLGLMSEITLTFKDGSLVGKSHKMHDLSKGSSVNAEVQAVADKYLDRPELHEEIATVEGPLSWRQVGSVVADALIWATGADISITNIGGVRMRDGFDRPVMTAADALTIDPFYNQVLTFRVSGRNILQVLEDMPSRDRYGPACVGGMSYTISLRKGSSSDRYESVKVTDARTLDGSAIDPDRTYTLATTSYVAGESSHLDLSGGIDEGLQSTLVLLDYIKAKGALTSEPERETVIID